MKVQIRWLSGDTELVREFPGSGPLRPFGRRLRVKHVGDDANDDFVAVKLVDLLCVVHRLWGPGVPSGGNHVGYLLEYLTTAVQFAMLSF